MNTAQALKKAQKIYGKNAAVDWRPQALTEAEKAPLLVERDAIRAIDQKSRTPEQVNRLKEIGGLTLGYRASVGRIEPSMGAFLVTAQADTFEEAFAKIDRTGK
jgi:hypothetical protein